LRRLYSIFLLSYHEFCRLTFILQVSSRGPAYAAYALQFEKDGIDGTVLENSSIDELIEIMNGMGVNTVHRLALKAAMTQWKQHAHLAVAIVAQASKPFGDADVGQWASLQALGFTAAGIIAATNASELFCAVGFNALVLAGFNVSSILKVIILAIAYTLVLTLMRVD
jgi:hypothetical protein